MRILEIVLVILSVIAIFMRFLFIPAADGILMISLTLLGMLYFFPFGAFVLNHIGLRTVFKGALKNSNMIRLVAGAAAGFGLSILCIAILFKILELTGADDMLLIGSVLTSVMIVIGVILYFKHRDKVAKYFIVRTVIGAVLGVSLFFTPTMTLVKWRFHKYPAYIQAWEESNNNPGVDSLLDKRFLEYDRIVLPEDAFRKREEEYNAKYHH